VDEVTHKKLAALDRFMDKMRYGEDANRGGESRAWSGAAIAGRERLDQGLEGFQGAGLDCAPGSLRNEGEPGPPRDRRSGGARCLRAWTPVRRRLGAAGRVTQDRLALLASQDACRTLRSQGRHGAHGRPVALHNTHRPDP
jgi:hypothetical protein